MRKLRRYIMSNSKTTNNNLKSYLHVVIGIAIMLVFQFLPAYGPITEVGMKCVGAFIGMVYLWSTVGALWPSLLGLIIIGLSGYAGEGATGFKAVFASAFGNDTVLLLTFNMILFGALDVYGCTKYIAKWCLTRKVINKRPYLFLAVVFITSYILSAIVAPTTAVLIIWPIGLHMMEALGVERSDKIWGHFFMGLFIMMCIGQPVLPFKGAQLIVLGTIENLAGSTISWGPYMLYNFILAALVLIGYLLILKFILKPDVTKLEKVSAEQVEEIMPLPAMNTAQKIMLISLPVYIIVLLLPNFISPDKIPFLKFFSIIGSTGTSCLFLIIFCIIKIAGKPVINYQEVSAKAFNWGTIFMVAAAVYGAGTLSNEATGVKTFIVDVLNPVLGGQPEIVFVALMFIVALLLTNIANNAGIALILLPVVSAFTEQLGIAFIPVAIGVGMMVFCALLTPAASPHTAMAFGRTDIYEGKTFIKIGIPFCIAYIALYVIVGYPLAKIFFM